MLRLKGWLGPLLVALVLLAPTHAHADEDSGHGYSSQAVQNRKYFGHHEFNLSVGTLPLDAFKKGITVSAGYTLHFDEIIAWEVAQFFYSFPIETDLNDDLAAFDIRPTPFEVVEYFLTSNFVFKPLYWKGALLNSGLIYGEMLFVIGGGYGWFTRSQRPCVDFGLAFRFYASNLLSLRLDVRHHLFFNTDAADNSLDVHQELWIGLGGSLSF